MTCIYMTRIHADVILFTSIHEKVIQHVSSICCILSPFTDTDLKKSEIPVQRIFERGDNSYPKEETTQVAVAYISQILITPSLICY